MFNVDNHNVLSWILGGNLAELLLGPAVSEVLVFFVVIDGGGDASKGGAEEGANEESHWEGGG